MKKYSHIFSYSLLLICLSEVNAEKSGIIKNDLHYSDIGFFDIHVCNWPNRNNFFKIVFSSEKYSVIDSMKIYTPENMLLTSMDKSKFITIHRKNKPDKRAYIYDLDVTDKASSGWYNIIVKAKNGKEYQAKDYVLLNRLSRATSMHPSDPDKEIKLPITLKWNPVAGTQHYQVFVRDEWTGKLMYKTKLINKNKVSIPKGKLEPGSFYSWVVHARDVNEHVLLGDFNMGSMSKKAFFSTAD